MFGEILFAAPPLAVLVGFIFSLVKFMKCPKENTAERKGYKIAAIILGIILGIMVLAAVSLMILTAAIIANM